MLKKKWQKLEYNYKMLTKDEDNKFKAVRRLLITWFNKC